MAKSFYSQLGLLVVLLGFHSTSFASYSGTTALKNLTSSQSVSYVEQNTKDLGGNSAVVGDFNGDTYIDIAVADKAYDSANTATVVGRVYIFYGDISGSSGNLSTADAIFDAEVTTNQYLGYSLAAADLDGNGVDELLITASEYSSYRGVVYILFGGTTYSGTISLSGISPSSATVPGVRLAGTNASERVRNVANAGDINNDGYEDILIGQQKNTNGTTYGGYGSVSIVYGSSTFTTSDFTSSSYTLASVADVLITGVNGTDELEFVAAAGDLDNDTYDDFMIGSVKYSSSKGIVYLVYGSNSLSGTYTASSISSASFASSSSYYSGRAMSAGDFNGDTYGDLIFGSYSGTGGSTGTTAKTGTALIFNGSSSRFSGAYTLNSTSATAFIRGTSASDAFGYSVAGVGDINKDGYDDALIGAYGRDQGYTNNGAAYLIYGSSSGITGTINASVIGSTTSGVTFTGAGTSYYAGETVAATGDIDSDGYDDFIITSPSSSSSSVAGKVYLVYGE